MTAEVVVELREMQARLRLERKMLTEWVDRLASSSERLSVENARLRAALEAIIADPEAGVNIVMLARNGLMAP